MSLLGDIARIFAQGTGAGMLQNAQWGYEQDRIKEANANADARMKKQFDHDDASAKANRDTQSTEAQKQRDYQSSEAQKQREWEEKQNELMRKSQERAAQIRQSGTKSEKDALSRLEMLDTTISGIDKERARLEGELDGAEPQLATQIKAQLNDLDSQRFNLINSQEANDIWAANGSLGKAHRSQFFTPDGKKGLLSDMQDAKQSTETQPSSQPKTVTVPRPTPQAKSSNVQTWDDVANSVKDRYTNPGMASPIPTNTNFAAPTGYKPSVHRVDLPSGGYTFKFGQ